MFQAMMNQVFGASLCRFVFIFFDDILICSHYINEQDEHVMQVFKFLQAHQFNVSPK